jgi:glycosyltransferase involved in cell wall biosynthesis
MREQAMKSVTAPNVSFECRGQTSNADIRTFYTEVGVHCFVNLSIVEGLPVSIMEAISHGIPVIATAVYGVPEVVIDGYNGLLLPAKFSNEQLDSALLGLMDSHQPMKELRGNARALFLQRFNAESNYKSFAAEIAALTL